MAKTKAKKAAFAPNVGIAVEAKGGRMATIIGQLERDLNGIEAACVAAESVHRRVMGIYPPDEPPSNCAAATALPASGETSSVFDLQERMQFQIRRLHDALQHLGEL